MVAESRNTTMGVTFYKFENKEFLFVKGFNKPTSAKYILPAPFQEKNNLLLAV